MTLPVSDQCRSCLGILHEVSSILSQPGPTHRHITHSQVNDELERFSLFVGNIGALHPPESSMSIESRLHEASDVLNHILGLLADLNEVAAELLDIISGKREGMASVIDEAEKNNDEETSEVNELREEISGTITRLFRISRLIRQAAPTDLFAKALSRDRYRFNDQFDIAHVGQKYPKLAASDHAWLRQRLGRAITQRRHYLSYIQDHREKLEAKLSNHDKTDVLATKPQAPIMKQSPASKPMLDMASCPSFFTKATTIAPKRITAQMLVAEESDPEDDVRSYTTISRSIDGDNESSTTVRIPKLDDLRIGDKKETECPFCFRIRKFKNERTWRKHVFSDLRSYVCTFPDCDAPYFGDINKWFHHEMTFHRVTYKCFFCPNTVFYQKEKYLFHLKRIHVEMLEDGGEQPGMDLARRPLAQIPASDCPCCSDWVDRLKKRASPSNESTPNDILAVVPTVFKRHLAGHLEQLALFAVPVRAATDGENNSNAAIEEERSKRTDVSQLSALTFASSRGDLDDASSHMEIDPSQGEILNPDFQDTDIEAARWKEDEKLGVQVMELRKGVLGEEHPDTLASMNSLALIYERQGQWAEAAALQLQVVETRKRLLGKEHPETLTSMADLASTCMSQGRWDEAEVLRLQVMETRERVLGKEHPDTLDSMASLAMTYERQDRYEAAEVLRLQVMETRKRVLGEEHTDTLDSMASLAMTYERQDRYEAAEVLRLQVMETRKRVLGEEHLDTLDSMNNLAWIYERQGRYEAAEVLRLQVMETRKRVLGEEHTDTLDSMASLAWIYDMQGRWDEAAVLEVQVMETRKRVLGEEHPGTLNSMNNLAWIYERQGRYEAGEVLRLQVMETRKRVLGEEHPYTLDSMESLATMYKNQKRLEEAKLLSIQVMETTMRVFGEEHPRTLSSFSNLGIVLTSQSKLEEAEAMHRRALDGYEKVLGSEDPDTLSSVDHLACVLRKQHRYEDALVLYKRASSGYQRILGKEHPTTMACLDRQSSLLQEMEDSTRHDIGKARDGG